MKTLWIDEKDQWILQEISYSLKEITHNGNRKSKSNALIYVILPNKADSYNYFENNYYWNTVSYRYSVIFDIMRKNLNNCRHDDSISYAVIVEWDTFIKNYSFYIELTVQKQEHIKSYNICKQI